MPEELIDKPLPAGNVQATPYAVRFGVIGGLICVVISVILYITELQFESWAKWLTTLAMFVIICIALRTISREHPQQNVEFGTLMGAGMVITLLITLISIGYFLIYVYVIDTEFIEATMEISRQKMTEAGMSEDQIDSALSISSKIMTPPIMAGIGAITSIILGSVISIIAAAIFKHEQSS
jgi:Protein of unknown function (DUF4199)